MPRIATHGASETDGLPAIQWGASQDIAYPATGSTAVSAGPFETGILRLALSSAGSGIRAARGSSAAAAIAACQGVGNSPPGTWMPGSMIEYLAINPGDYIAAVSNDGNVGNLNITMAITGNIQ